jgi:hypothetical protein
MLEERQAIKQIQKLKKIKPNKDWVLLTKREILKEEESRVWNVLFAPIRKPALVFAFRGAIAALVLIAGASFYLYYSNSQINNIVSIPFISNQVEDAQLIASLNEVQKNLADIKNSLAKLKEIRNPGQALTMTEVIKETAQRNREVVERIKNQAKTKQVLASLGEIGSTLNDIGEESHAIQQQMIESALLDLEGRTLSSSSKGLLEKAKTYYNEGKMEEAMILIMKIYENKLNN